jgi:hypothetical protein
MSNQVVPTAPSKRPPFSFWALVPVVLLGFLMSIVILMVAISANDPGFAVEPDYYKKAVDWDAHQAQVGANDRLGWQVRWHVTPASALSPEARVELELFDRSGRPITGAMAEMNAFHNARAGQIQSLTLIEGDPGQYVTALEVHRAGLWEFRVRLSHQGDIFTHTQQIDLTRTAGAKREPR